MITNLLAKDKILVILLVLLTSLLAVDPFLHRGIFTAHDIEANTARFGAFAGSFMEGNLIPRWAKDLAQGYGSPILSFSYSIPYYLALPFRLLGFSLVDCMKILTLLSIVGSALTMYLFLRFYFPSSPSFLGSLLYVFTPYRISNIYARGSISENTAFIFIPLAAWLMSTYWKKPSLTKISLLSFSFALIILSHPFFGVISAPFFLGLIIFLFLKEKNWGKLAGLAAALVLTLGVTAYFTLPLLFENKYTHYDINPFSLTYKTEGITLSQLIFPQWTFIDRTGKLEYQTWQLGIVNLILFISSMPLFFVGGFKKKSVLILGLLLFILSAFLSLKIALPLYEILKPLQQIQFPWRFLALSVMSLPLIAAPVFAFIEERFRKLSFLLGITTITIVLILNLPYAKGHGYQTKSDNYYLYEMTNNTEGPATQPRWASMPELYPKKSKQLEIIEGQGTQKEVFIKSTLHEYNIEAKTNLNIVDNTFYYPGWQVRVDNKEVPVEFQNEAFRGLITFRMPKGSHQIEVRFVDTKLRRTAEIASLVFIVAALTLMVIPGKFLKNFSPLPF